MTELRSGDIVFYLWPPRGLNRKPEWAVVSSASHLNPNVVFGRNQDGKARAIHRSDITRIQTKETHR